MPGHNLSLSKQPPPQCCSGNSPEPLMLTSKIISPLVKNIDKIEYPYVRAALRGRNILLNFSAIRLRPRRNLIAQYVMQDQAGCAQSLVMSPLWGFVCISHVFYNNVSPSGLKCFYFRLNTKPRRGEMIIELQKQVHKLPRSDIE